MDRLRLPLNSNVGQLINVPTFIGIDLAWQSDRNHTGAVALRGDRDGAELVAVSDSIRSLNEVRVFVTDHVADETVVAIDAPLIIENLTGQRPCETAVGRVYGRREASCHTSNRRLYPSAASIELAKELVAAGYIHAPTAGADADKILLEVYPHAGLVALFDLAKSLKYKKGSSAQKRLGLGVLTSYLRQLTLAVPAVHENALFAKLMAVRLTNLGVRGLKAHEDRLDAFFCAYLAYYFWYWRVDRVEMFGDVTSGYIANPKLQPGGIVSHATQQSA